MPRRPASVGWARSADDLRAALRGISNEAAAAVLEPAVRAACQPILIAARRFAKRSEATGALRESLVIKTVAYKNNGRAVGMVGPDRAYYLGGKKVGKLGALLGRKDRRRPANYAHLVEYGHLVAKGGSLRAKHVLTLEGTGRYSAKGKELKRWRRGRIVQAATGKAIGFVPPKPFLRPAVITTRVAQTAAFEAAVRRGLDRLYAKHRSTIARAA